MGGIVSYLHIMGLVDIIYAGDVYMNEKNPTIRNGQFSETYAYKEMLAFGTILGFLFYFGYESGLVIPALKVGLTYLGNCLADLGGKIEMLQSLHAPTAGLDVMMAHASQEGLANSVALRPEVAAPIQKVFFDIFEAFK